MHGVTVKDVPANQLIEAYAAHLKRQGKLEVPTWVDIAKTATFKELGPYNEDWFYVRAAALARHIYLRGGVGVGALRKVYGGPRDSGTRPRHHARATGSVIRKALQALEKIKVVRTDEDGGRYITKTGQRDLDRVATQLQSA